MTLLSIYIASAVLGLGITVIDMMGLFGDESSETEGADGDDGAEVFSTDNTESDFDGEAAGESAEDGEADSNGTNPSAVGHDSDEKRFRSAYLRKHRRSLALTVLSGARNIVYFALGFGPAGLFALSQMSEPQTLLWSIPVGAVSLAGARMLRRLVRKELDSQISTEELLLEPGKVTVGIAPGELGKVRIHYSGAYVERYARAADPAMRIEAGRSIRVADIGDDCIYVEPENSIPDSLENIEE